MPKGFEYVGRLYIRFQLCVHRPSDLARCAASFKLSAEFPRSTLSHPCPPTRTCCVCARVSRCHAQTCAMHTGWDASEFTGHT